MTSEFVNKFITNIELLLAGEPICLYESFVSSSLEYIGQDLHHQSREQGIWYDGCDELFARKRKKNQIEFTGNMWVMLEQKKSWQEPMIALITDKRCTNQGMWIMIKIGEHKGEKNLYEM